MKTAFKALISAGVLAVAAAIVMAQAPPSFTPPKPVTGSDTVAFKATLGSFKFLGSGDTPVKGKLSVAFRGTMLLTDPKGNY
ncbi:hypothetical protein EON81_19465, partial [bacterium]